MGTDDQIYDFFYNDDGGEETPGDWITVGSGYNSYATNTGLAWTDSTSAGGKYKSIIKNTPSGEWEVTFILQRAGSQQSTLQCFGYIKLSDGNYYMVGMRGIFSLPTKLSWKKQATQPTDTFEAMTYTNDARRAGWNVVTLRFKSNGNVDIVRKYSDEVVNNMKSVLPTITDCHERADQYVESDVTTWSGAKIEEVGYIGNGTHSGIDAHYFFGMYIEADLPTPEGGTADLGDIRNISATKMFGGGGGANIFSTYDANVVDEATIRANYRKSITIQDTVYGTMRFKGEINYIDIIRDADIYHVNYRAAEDIRKLSKQFCRVTPIQLNTILKSTKNNMVYDYLASWTINEFASKIMTTTDKDLYKTYVHPTSVSQWRVVDGLVLNPATWIAGAVHEEAGSIDHLYFDDESKTDDNAYGIVGTRGVLTDPYTHIMVFEFTVYESDDISTWDQAFLEVIGRWNSFKGARVWGTDDSWYPAILKFNYTTGLYEMVYQYTPDDHSTSDVGDDDVWQLDELNTVAYNTSADGAGKSPVFTDKVGILFDADHKTNVTSANASGFRSYTVKIAISATTTDMDITNISQRYPILELHQFELLFDQELTKSDPQGQNYSTGKILSNTATTITLDSTTNAVISVNTFPQGDGVTKGDGMYITDNVEEVLADIFATADTDFTKEEDFNNDYTTYGEIDDLYDTPIYDYIQKLSGNHNWAYWSASTVATNVIKIADNFNSSGITLTSADIMNYTEGGLDLKENAQNMYDAITVIGANGIRVTLVNGVDYNVEYSNTLGNEEIIYRDKELYTKRNITAYATSKALLHSTVLYDVVLTLDLTDPYQSYLAIDIGKTVAIETDELSTTTIGQELVVKGMIYTSMEEQGSREFLTLLLQRRVV